MAEGKSGTGKAKATALGSSKEASPRSQVLGGSIDRPPIPTSNFLCTHPTIPGDEKFGVCKIGNGEIWCGEDSRLWHKNMQTVNGGGFPYGPLVGCCHFLEAWCYW